MGPVLANVLLLKQIRETAMCEISTVLKLQKTEMATDEMVAFIFVRFTCRVGFEVKLYNYIANSSKGCLNRDPS